MKELLYLLESLEMAKGKKIDLYELAQICKESEKVLYKVCEAVVKTKGDIEHIKKFII